MIKEWEYSAKILIYYYRAVLKGMVPFASPWEEKHANEMSRICALDGEALRYVRRVAEIIQCRGEWLT